MKLTIGRKVDPASLTMLDEPAVLDGNLLTRHAVCIGMTGSGKTGLCVALLEEIASAGVPLLIIDPKGDLGNLALAFDGSRASDYLPWVDVDQAAREGVSAEALAARTAQRWKEQLALWGVGPDRIARFAEGASVSIYTPGATFGRAVDLLGSLFSPPAELASDAEARQELVAGTVQSLLGLVGAAGDALTDPAHLLLARVFDEAWSQGTPLDFETLIARLVDPPFAKLGVFPVETFFPRAARMKLAMQLNGLVASPAFAAWAEGDRLDVDAWMRPGADGRTPVRVFSLSHLDEAGREFFIGQLLTRLVAWSRRQSGTSALRGFLYFDEVYGYLPPHPRNPPTKRPMLTLMKQARAVGLGTMLVTQNPVDLDYAALANSGLWLIGRLQTAQDRDKVVDGLVGAGAGDPAALAEAIARLPARTFVVREAGAPGPVLVHSRQTISFLRGPLNRAEIGRLRGAEPQGEPVPTASTVRPSPPPEAAPEGYTAAPPPSPLAHPFRYVSTAAVFSARHQAWSAAAAIPARADGRTVYEPALYARLELRFDEGKEFVFTRDEHRLFFPIHQTTTFAEPDFAAGDLVDRPEPQAWFAPIPTHVDEPRELQAFERRVVDDVLRGETEQAYVHRGLKLESRAGETREAFIARVEAALESAADEEVRKLEDKARKEAARLEEKRTRLQRDRDRLAATAKTRQVTEAVSVGETLLGLFFGTRRVTSSITSAVNRRATTAAATGRVEEADQEIADLENEIYEASNRLADEIEALRKRTMQRADEVETLTVQLERPDLRLQDFSIVWVPVTRSVR